MIENLYVFRTDEKGEKRSGTSTTCIRYVIDTCIIIYSKTQALCNTNEQGKNHYLPLCFSNFVILSISIQTYVTIQTFKKLALP